MPSLMADVEGVTSSSSVILPMCTSPLPIKEDKEEEGEGEIASLNQAEPEPERLVPARMGYGSASYYMCQSQ